MKRDILGSVVTMRRCRDLDLSRTVKLPAFFDADRLKGLAGGLAGEMAARSRPKPRHARASSYSVATPHLSLSESGPRLLRGGYGIQSVDAARLYCYNAI